jgi:hypothetical protein
MVPKKTETEGKKPAKPIDPKAEKRKADLEQRRRENAVFSPPALDKNTLIDRHAYMWGRDTQDHIALVVLPADTKVSGDAYPFFCAYFYCGLVPPYSDFFTELMYTFGFWLLDFTLNAMTCMSVFAHMCENFVGVVPNVTLFCHFFIPCIEGDALSGIMTWIPQAKANGKYLTGMLHLKWEEWRAEWCWIKEKDFPSFCVPRTEKIEQGKD